MHRPIIRNFKKKVHSPFIDNIQVADLADMHFVSKFNKGFTIFFSVIDIYSKYAQVIPLKDDESNHKPNKIWVDEDGVLYNRSMKQWLDKNDTVMYSTYNEGKCVIAEKLIGTLQNKIFEYMTSVSKKVYIDKLDNIVNKYNNTYHSTNKMKPVDVKSNINSLE